MKAFMKWGIIFALFSILMNVLTYFGVSSKIFTNVSGIIAFVAGVAIYYFFLKEFRDKENNGFLSIGEGIKESFKMVLIPAFVVSLYIIGTWNFIGSEVAEQQVLQQEEALYEAGAPQSQINMTMKIFEYMFSKWTMAAMTFFGSFFGALIYGLIMSAVLKKVKPENYESDDFGDAEILDA